MLPRYVIFGLLLGQLTSGGKKLQTLDDTSFEHETQASTGGTTGSWLVSFEFTGCKECDKIFAAMEELDDELRELYTIPARILSTSVAVRKRFKVKSAPTTLLISHGKMYRFTNVDEDDLKAALLKFTQEPGEGVKVPPEPTALSEILDKVYSFFGSSGDSEL